MGRFFSWSKLDNALIGAAVLTAAGFGVNDMRKRIYKQSVPEEQPRYRFDTALHDAAARGEDARALTLLREGAEIDETDRRFGRSALSVAAEHGHTTLVEELARRRPALVNQSDRHGMTALELAAWRGHTSTVSALLRLGASADTTDHYGVTAMHKAAALGHTAVVTILCRHDTKLAQKRVAESFSVAGEYGTPLHVAAGKGHAEVVRVLLEEGQAVVDAKDQEQCTALHHGAESLAVVSVLLSHGADPRLRCHGQHPAALCGVHAFRARARLQQAAKRADEETGRKAEETADVVPGKTSLGWQDNAAALIAQSTVGTSKEYAKK